MQTLKLLRKRKLVQWALAYAAGAWALLQVLGLMAENYEWSHGVMRVAFGMVVIGFLITLVLAWYHGERGEQKVSGTELVILTLLLAIGGGVLWRSNLQVPTSVATSVPMAKQAPDKSIAVLPFDNMSGSKDNEYFADGIAEELLNQLAQLPGLQVAGRTSSFVFKGRDEDLREIGRKLGVAYVLEGSVRRAGSRVRITAQLIRAESGFHVWSETYDRELTDIFAVQDEISGAITAALKLNLMSAGAGIPSATKVAVGAYDSFLKGQSLLALRGTDHMYAAREQYQAALKIDPDYAPALVGLARADLLIPLYGYLSGASSRELVSEAEQALRRALVIDPNNASAHVNLGILRMSYQWRWQDAERELARAEELAPGSADVLNFSGDLYRILLDPVRAIPTEQHALELDPLAPFNRDDMAFVNMAFGHYEQALVHANKLKQMMPEYFDAYLNMAVSYGYLKRFPEMHRAIAQARVATSASEAQFLYLDVLAAIAEDHREDALHIQAKLEPFAEAGQFSSGIIGYNYLLLGDPIRARRWLQTAYEQKDPPLVFPESIDLQVIARDPLTRGILDQPGLKELVDIRKRNGMFKSP